MNSSTLTTWVDCCVVDCCAVDCCIVDVWYATPVLAEPASCEVDERQRRAFPRTMAFVSDTRSRNAGAHPGSRAKERIDSSSDVAVHAMANKEWCVEAMEQKGGCGAMGSSEALT